MKQDRTFPSRLQLLRTRAAFWLEFRKNHGRPIWMDLERWKELPEPVGRNLMRRELVFDRILERTKVAEGDIRFALKEAAKEMRIARVREKLWESFRTVEGEAHDLYPDRAEECAREIALRVMAKTNKAKDEKKEIIARAVSQLLINSPVMQNAFADLMEEARESTLEETTGKVRISPENSKKTGQASRTNQFSRYFCRFLSENPDFLEMGQQLRITRDYNGNIEIGKEEVEYSPKQMPRGWFSFALIGAVLAIASIGAAVGLDRLIMRPKPAIVETEAAHRIEKQMHPSQKALLEKKEGGADDGPEEPVVLATARKAIGNAGGPLSITQIFRIHNWLTSNIRYENVSKAEDPRLPSRTLKDAKAGDCKSLATTEASMLEGKDAETIFIDWDEPSQKNSAGSEGHEFLGVLVWSSGEKDSAQQRISAIRNRIMRDYWGDLKRIRMVYSRREIGPHFLPLHLHGRDEIYLLLDPTFGKHSVPGMANLGEKGLNIEISYPYPATTIVNYLGKILKIYDARPNDEGRVPDSR